MSQICRRRFLVAAGACLTTPLAVAQQAGRKYRVATMFPLGVAAMQPYRAALSK